MNQLIRYTLITYLLAPPTGVALCLQEREMFMNIVGHSKINGGLDCMGFFRDMIYTTNL